MILKEINDVLGFVRLHLKGDSSHSTQHKGRCPVSSSISWTFRQGDLKTSVFVIRPRSYMSGHNETSINNSVSLRGWTVCWALYSIRNMNPSLMATVREKNVFLPGQNIAFFCLCKLSPARHGAVKAAYAPAGEQRSSGGVAVPKRHVWVSWPLSAQTPHWLWTQPLSLDMVFILFFKLRIHG